MTAKTIWLESDIRYIKDHYFTQGYEEMSQALGVSTSVIHRKAKELGLPLKTEFNRLEYQYGMPMKQLLELYHFEKEMSVNKMAQEFGVHRASIMRWMSDLGIEWRGSSEAERLKWAKMTPEQRQKQTEKAHNKTREATERGEGPLQVYQRENPEEFLAQVKRNGRLGSAERERRGTNAMVGKVGPAHHAWKGGKDEYHRLRSITLGNWWVERKKALRRDGYTCRHCGVKRGKGVIIDVHHIKSLREGGTNLVDNLICYCRQCHQIIEWEENRRKAGNAPKPN